MTAATKSQAVDVAMFAVANYGRKNGDRKALDSGAKYPVELVVSGTAAGEKVREKIVGDVTVGHDGTTKRTKSPDTILTLTAVLEDLVGPRKLKQRLALLAEQFDKKGELPAPKDDGLTEQVTAFLNRVTKVTDQPRSGSVSFVPQL